MDRISALMDGELDEREARVEIARLKQQELRAAWDAFHVIGDAVRGDFALSTDFSRRVSERLEQEPTILAPGRGARRKFGAYALSAAASLSAISLVAWVALSTNVPVVTQPELAVVPVTVNPEPAVVAEALPDAASLLPASVPDDGRMSEYLLAHQGFSPSTALQGVVPYIRSVSVRQSEITR
jgi:sigma-E factor negative regulatory protein RseA